MLRRALILAAAAALSAAPVSASEKAAPKGPDLEKYVDLSPVALPIVADGRLVNYVFAYVRIHLNNGANTVKLREKEPFFRDALVRAGHRTPFTSSRDYLTLDERKLKAALMPEAVAIAGPGAVRSIEITSQAPKKRAGVPTPKPAAART
jgi:hypothetical protein